MIILMLVLATAVVAVDALAADAAGSPICATRNLRIRQSGSEGALGTRLVTVSYQNTTRVTCRTGGFPGVTLYGAGGRKLTVAGRVATRQAKPLVKSGKRVYGVVSYGETPVPESQRCPAVTALLVYAPNSRESTHVSLHQAGVYCHRAEVYPLASSAQKSLNG
jgi:Protein of unknown function (DUF4232)